jgi:hypothetical protein
VDGFENRILFALPEKSRVDEAKGPLAVKLTVLAND